MAVTRLREGRPPLIVATGGDEIREFAEGRLVYRVHEFKMSGDFVVSSGGGLVEVMLVAGGGGGGGTVAARVFAGQGGGGGVLFGTVSVSPGTYPVTVGSGGSGGSQNVRGSQGDDSEAFGLTAVGGGGGFSTGHQGTSGGSGGHSNNFASYLDGVFGQGNSGSRFATDSNDGAGGQRQTTATFTGRLLDVGGLGQIGREVGNANGIAGPNNPMENLGTGGAPANGGNLSAAVGGKGSDGFVAVRYLVRYL